MGKGIASVILGRMDKAGPASEAPVEDEGGSQAAESSAMGEFIAAVKAGDSAGALSAFKELYSLCGG